MPGVTKTCTITNEEKLAYVIVNKTVTNHGGSKVVSDFAPYKVGVTTVTLGATTLKNSGTYTVSETTDSNYTQTFSGDCGVGGSITLVGGTTKTCNITNEEKLAGIIVNKTVINHGGTLTLTDFAPYKVGTTTVTQGITTYLNYGTYTVSETVNPNYTQTFSGDCDSGGSITLVQGVTKTCTITNEEKLATITVNKVVINHGLAKVAADFAPYKLGTRTVSVGVSTTSDSGLYTVSETADPNYTQTFSGDCNSSGQVSLVGGTSKTCTITNEEKLSYITVNKVVINHGGTKITSDFAPYKVGAITVTAGVSTAINSGTYTVSETANANYIQTFSGDCNSSGSVTLTTGNSKTCTITNEEKLVPGGIMVYGDNTTTSKYRIYGSTANTFATQTTALTATAGQTFVVRNSPNQIESLAGYVNSAGLLTVMCFDGSNWSQEWTATVGGTGSTRRFDISYETASGDAMVLYSTNAGTTNELAYRTKSGGNRCGSANWSAASSLDPVRTTGVVQWVKMAWDKRTGQDLITAIWADANSDLSVMVWSGTAWGNEPTAALATTLQVITTAQDVEDFDVEYESLSGDVMVIWGIVAAANANGVRYATCTGGTSACAWSAVTTPATFVDDATNLDISANPNTDQIVFASVGKNQSDLQIGYWSGSAWTNTANADTSCNPPAAGTKLVSTGWVVSGATSVSVVRYADQGSSAVDWYTGSAGVFTKQTDWTQNPATNGPAYFDVQMDPVNKNQILATISDGAISLLAKRLVFTAPSTYTWTNSDATVLTSTLTQSINSPFSFAFLRY